MSPRRPRGTVQEPVEDYHDTNRPAHRKSRPGGHPTKNTTETASNKTTPNQKELHMSQTTNAPAHPANVPPRFRAECDTDGSLMFWGADLVAEDDFEAEAVKYPAAPDITRYSVALRVEEGTAEETRAALDRLCAWWASQEAHLDGAEVAR